MASFVREGMRPDFYTKQIGEFIIDCRIIRKPGPTMEFTAIVSGHRHRDAGRLARPAPLALGLFAAVLIACVATYLHHATDTLKLSF